MKIVINSKENKKLLENFPEDPYADITIITQYSKLHLVLAYLSIDSEYFANLDPNIKEIDLSHLNQQPLLKVLKSLYGAELIAYSVPQLFSLYSIIQELQIQQYKTLLKQSIQQILATQKDNPILNSIQMLQFCIKNEILVQQLKNFHFDTKLKILQSSKNYLQLNKLSQATLSSLLLDFHASKIQKGDQIINHIMQNYFNRKNIRPAIFFANQQYEQLKKIWQKYHHKIATTSDLSTASQQRNSATLSNTISNFSQVNSFGLKEKQTQMRRSQTNFNTILKAPVQTTNSTLFKSQTSSQNQQWDSKISSLQQELKTKDQFIRQLKLELTSLKQTKTMFQVDSDHENQQSQTSLLINLKKHKKSKEVALIDLENIRQVESFQTSKSFINAARVIPGAKNNSNSNTNVYTGIGIGMMKKQVIK